MKYASPFMARRMVKTLLPSEHVFRINNHSTYGYHEIRKRVNAVASA